jgi:hypothetical protein
VLALTLAWVFVGCYGVWSYAHDYYLYRGFGPPRDPPGVDQGSLRSIRFRSAALGAMRTYDVYLPPGYAAAAAQGRRFGVLYLLHGAPGRRGCLSTRARSAWRSTRSSRATRSVRSSP